jgi:hypothetical protein
MLAEYLYKAKGPSFQIPSASSFISYLPISRYTIRIQRASQYNALKNIDLDSGYEVYVTFSSWNECATLWELW